MEPPSRGPAADALRLAAAGPGDGAPGGGETRPGEPAPSQLPFGATVTIVFSDIRGFTEFTEQHGDEAAYRLLQQHNAIVRKQVELFGGQVVKTQGDSFMVSFRTARAAIQCAVAVQRSLEAAPAPPGGGIALGIGINTGEPIQEGGDFFGSPVNLAARICAAAGPGQILISETTRSVAGRIDGVEFVDRGLFDLKGFHEPQRVFEVRWLGPGARGGQTGAALREELASLAERCARLGPTLLAAARAMVQEGGAPPPNLAGEIAALRASYAELRARVLERAAGAGLETSGNPEAWSSLGELEPLVAALERAEAERKEGTNGAQTPEAEGEARQVALEAAVQRALVVLSQILAVRHRDDPAFQPLLECQARASDLRVKLSRLPGTGREFSPQRVDETLLPFADLLTLVTGQQDLDDQRWMEAEENVARVFGRQLAIAATRGRLVVSPVDRRSPETAAPEPSVGEADPLSGAPGDPRGPSSLPLPDPRGAAVTWWTAAHGAWVSWKRSGMALAHALRAVLARHPYLLSVPIRQSVDYDRGRLASGYFLLLEHVENLQPSFLRSAVERALERTGQVRDPGVLGQALYEVLVREGRLAETYPDFVRDVMVAAIPTPGVWLDAIITESDEATLVVTRPGRAPGDADEVNRTLTEPAARQGAHHVSLVVAPLTTRFVCIRRGELREPRDVTVTLSAQGAPSEEAWLLTLRSDYLMHAAPRRPEGSVVTLEGFGRSWSALWVAVFNRDPEAERRVELAATIRPCAPAGPRRSVFGLKAR